MASVYQRPQQLEQLGRRKAPWHYRVRVKGYKQVSGSRPTKESATKAAQRVEIAMRDGTWSSGAADAMIPIGTLIDSYVEATRGAPQHELRHVPQGREWKRELGASTACGRVTSLDVVKAIRRIKDRRGLKGSTANRYLSFLSGVYTHALTQDHVQVANPVRDVRRFKEQTDVGRCLDPYTELPALLAACRNDPDLYAAVTLSLCTGGRQSEVLGLLWSDVNLAPGRESVTFASTKNGEPRTVPIVNMGAMDALAALRERHAGHSSDMVFAPVPGKDRANLRAAFERAVKASGIERFRWHDMRHTCASYLAASGASVAEIMLVLGHKTPTMAMRYAHLNTSHSRVALDRVRQAFEEA